MVGEPTQSELFASALARYREAEELYRAAVYLAEGAYRYDVYEDGLSHKLEEMVQIASGLYDRAGSLMPYPGLLAHKAQELEYMASSLIGLRLREIQLKAADVRGWIPKVQALVDCVLYRANSWQSEHDTFAEMLRDEAQASEDYWSDWREYNEPDHDPFMP